MKKDVKSRNGRAKRRNNRPNPTKAAHIPAVVKAEGARGKGPSMAKAEIPVAVRTKTVDAKPVSVATAEIPVEVNLSPKPGSSKRGQRRSKRTSGATVVPMAMRRTAEAGHKRTARRHTPRRSRRVVARREHKPVRNESVAAPSLLGMVVSAAAVVQETVVNTAAKLSMTIINGVESIIRRLFRFEERTTANVSGVVESVQRQAADVASRAASAMDTLAAA